MKILNFAKATVALFMLANFVTIALGDSAKVPSDLKVSASSCNSITLNWSATNDSSTSPLAMLIGYNGQNGAYETEASLSSSVNSYNDSGLQSSRQYCYKIRGEKNIDDINNPIYGTDKDGKQIITGYNKILDTKYSNTVCPTT